MTGPAHSGKRTLHRIPATISGDASISFAVGFSMGVPGKQSRFPMPPLKGKLYQQNPYEESYPNRERSSNPNFSLERDQW
jgi:hypothetical protein